MPQRGRPAKRPTVPGRLHVSIVQGGDADLEITNCDIQSCGQDGAAEAAALRSQFATSNSAGKMGLRRRPYAFTEQGVAMLSSVLNSDRAVEVNIAIMRAFVRLRGILSTHKDLARKLEEIEKKLGQHDDKFRLVFEAIRQLMLPPPEPKRRIGFARDN